MIGRIYYLKDPVTNEIRYIGQTRLTIEKRCELHWIGRNQGKNKNNHTANWISKLWINYKVKPTAYLIEENEWTNEQLNEKELFYINKYLKEGFNITNTCFNPQYRHLSYPKYVNGKKIYCYDKKYNELIFVNSREAAEKLNISYKEISSIANGRKTNKEFVFSFEKLNNEQIDKKRNTKTKCNIGIICRDLDTNEELEFNTQQDAAKYFKINFRNINLCLKGKRISCANNIWRYKDSTFKSKIKKILHIETNLEFNNIEECVLHFNINYASIVYNINYSKYKKFKYIENEQKN
jgi:hypothetical protein